jgi:hypothetical protein
VAKHCESGRRAPHFAHAHGADCVSAVETALHLAAKQRIAERGELWFPALTACLEAKDARGLTHKVTKELSAPGIRPLSAVVVESPVATMRPDLVAQCREFGAVLIEIAVTHFVDDVKLDKISLSGMAAIEVDLSHLRIIDFAQLDALLFAPNTCTRWLYQERLQRCEERLRAELQQRLDQASADAREALHAARTFAGLGPAQRSGTSGRQEPHWVRELEAAARTAQRARDFSNKSEEEKGAALCRWLSVAALPAFLTARCRHANAFGVSDAAIWQCALFLGQIDGQLRRGISRFNAEDALAWLAQRFRIATSREQDARLALQAYVAFLRAAGVLATPGNGSYPIIVADLGALAAGIVASQPGVGIDNELCWTGRDEWSSGLQAKLIFEASGLPVSLEQRRRLLCLSPTAGASLPSHFCDTIAWSFRIEIDQLIDYLARAGYLRVKPIKPCPAAPGSGRRDRGLP